MKQIKEKNEQLVKTIKINSGHMSALADILTGLIIFEHVYGSKIRWSGL